MGRTGADDGLGGAGAWWTVVCGEGPVVATALHAGHAVRDEVACRLAVGDAARLREEDPHTDLWTAIAPSRIVAHRSRFEVDLNRPRDQAVYLDPDDAWGLEVWREAPGPDLVRHSLAIYDAFYRMAAALFDALAERHERFAVLDLHSYNHRRHGPDSGPSDPADNPEVNLGTGTLPGDRWRPVVDAFAAALAGLDHERGPLDVRENVRFRGGHFASWIHDRYDSRGCALAVELKKTFMDEWTGETDPREVARIGAALAAGAAAVEEALLELAPP